MEFNEQVHSQQIAELRERLEQSAATIISLESRVRDLTKTDMSIPEVLQQVRESSEIELRRYQMESEENYSRNVRYFAIFLSIYLFILLDSLSSIISRAVCGGGKPGHNSTILAYHL